MAGLQNSSPRRFIIAMILVVAVSYPIGIASAVYLAVWARWPWYHWAPISLATVWGVSAVWLGWAIRREHMKRHDSGQDGAHSN